MTLGTSLVAPWLKNLPSSAADSVSTPDGGTEILHVMGRSSPQLLSPSPTAEAPHSQKKLTSYSVFQRKQKWEQGSQDPVPVVQERAENDIQLERNC